MIALVFKCAAWIVATGSLAAAIAGEIHFSRDVRPILSDNCFHCHGPDPNHRKANLRLDKWEETGEVSGAKLVVEKGEPQLSELFARITSDDPSHRMPPPDSGKSLTPAQIETFRKWIAAGAPYSKHWAFEQPVRPELPTVKHASWVQNPIDAFVLARLERENLSPSPAADANTLFRRLSLDLIGLPPTVPEIRAFESATSTDAYRQEVERLLASPHFGEKWGRMWLDVARYADSDGFEKDKPREVWMYRDWVVRAFNRDMPYDQFVVEQLAGDLLPVPTQNQRVATGFLRNSMINEEGGIDPEQFRMEAMFDRMDAIGKGILGLTIQCAQCHTHKYDPLKQVDYYRVLAFINNCHEAQIAVYTREQKKQWANAHREIRRIEDGLREQKPDWQKQMNAWEQTVSDSQSEWTIVRPEPVDESGQKYYLEQDGSILAAGYSPVKTKSAFVVEVRQPKITAVRLELLNDPSLPRGGPGRSVYGTCALSEIVIEAAERDPPAERRKLKITNASSDVNPAEREVEGIFDDRSGKRRITGPIEFAHDGKHETAWGTDIGGGRSNVPRKAVFVFDEPLDATDGLHLHFTLVQDHGGWNGNENQSNNVGRFRLSVTAVDKPTADPLPHDVRTILQTPAADRKPEEIDRVFSYWRTTVPEWADENRRIEALWQSHPRGTTQLVLRERKVRRTTHRLERGNFLSPAEQVAPGVPDFLHPMTIESEADSTPSRLDFAKWLVDRRSPTAARSIVNRIWQAYFGTGIVATAEDLGTQGDPPSHPQLLDWLAVELMDHSWNLKHIHRLIVTSNTYQQSSAAKPELLARDPANRLLARGARFRVDAELVRDIGLATSGLLYRKIGGPSAYPPAPEFLFEPPASYGHKTWTTASGRNRYRRALYTFRFRSVPYPMLQTFDTPNGEVSCARRACSNTPLQALVLLNEPLFVECARALALEILSEGGTSDTDRLTYAVRRCLSRSPTPQELAVLHEFLDQQKERFRKAGSDPWLLIAGDEEEREKVAASLTGPTDASVLAAWTALARVVLSLDETITKE